MAQKKSKRGLGRGLEALIQNTNEEQQELHIEQHSASGQAASPKKDYSESPAEDVASRYIKSSVPSQKKNQTQTSRRPVDIFFPEAPSQTAAVPEKNGRREMPNPMAGRRSAAQRRTQSNGNESPEQYSGSMSDGTILRELEVSSITPNPRQPREVFDEDDMEELIASIKEVGVLQPIITRPLEEGKYELVMGERRWRAAKHVGLETIPSIVRKTEDKDLLRDALLENIHRSELNPLEEAAAYQQLLTDFNCTQDELSERIGRSRPQITNTIRLMRLPALVQKRVASGVLSAGHARALLSLEEEETMEKVAQKVVLEGLSVRATEEMVSLEAKGGRKRRREQRANTAQTERFDGFANALTDALETNVKISLGKKKGKIAIDFASVEDLNRIMDLIKPEES